MKQNFVEESVLFVSVLKWFVLASAVGVAVGLSTALFLKILAWSIDAAARIPLYFLALPAGFFLSALMVRYWAPEAGGYGTEKVIEAVHSVSGRMRGRIAPAKLGATLVTAASGGSVGQVGPCAQIGAALASAMASLLRFNDIDRKKLVICGISAGFASVLGAPIAGAIFGVEVLFIGGILYEVLLPSFIAGVTSYQVSSWLGIAYLHYPVHLLAPFSEMFFIKVAFAGVFFGLCAVAFVEIMRFSERVRRRAPGWPPLWSLVAGIGLILLTFLTSPLYLGLGMETIHDALRGEMIAPAAFLMKSLFTGISLHFGGSGGIITPIAFVGATAGSFFADVFSLDRAVFAALGLVSLLAGAANTPIAASILAMEIIDTSIAPYAAVSCVISFLMTGHRSVFPTQVLKAGKSSSMNVNIGGALHESARARFQPREHSLLGLLFKMGAGIRRRWPGKEG